MEHTGRVPVRLHSQKFNNCARYDGHRQTKHIDTMNHHHNYEGQLRAADVASYVSTLASTYIRTYLTFIRSPWCAVVELWSKDVCCGRCCCSCRRCYLLFVAFVCICAKANSVWPTAPLVFFDLRLGVFAHPTTKVVLSPVVTSTDRVHSSGSNPTTHQSR